MITREPTVGIGAAAPSPLQPKQAGPSCSKPEGSTQTCDSFGKRNAWTSKKTEIQRPPRLMRPLTVPKLKASSVTSPDRAYRAAVIKVVMPDCIRLLANLSRNYTTGLTRMDAGKQHLSHDAAMYANLLRRCVPTIYGGAAYTLLQQALAQDTATADSASAVEADPAPPQTADIDVRMPFPTLVKKRSWQQFMHKSATRGFEVAQDRIFELVELLNLSSTQLVSKINSHGMVIHQQAACPTTNGIDVAYLTSLARKRPSSRYDHVFPAMGDMGPFFMSVAWNEHALFYTFKVCYVWSAPDVCMGEPQYNELIEIQMVPKLATELSSDSYPATPAFQVQHVETLGESEWPTLHGKQASSRKGRTLQPRWTSNIFSGDAAQQHGHSRGQLLCVEDPSVLAGASGLAVSNRLKRHCHKAIDWEKVHNDEARVLWLEWAARSRALTKLQVADQVQEAAVEECQRVLRIREAMEPESAEEQSTKVLMDSQNKTDEHSLTTQLPTVSENSPEKLSPDTVIDLVERSKCDDNAPETDGDTDC